MQVAGLVLLCLAGLCFTAPWAIAQEVVGQYRWRLAIDLTVLSVDQEKAKAAKPGSDFKERRNGCPVMIVIPAGKFIMGSPENESDRNASAGQQHEVNKRRTVIGRSRECDIQIDDPSASRRHAEVRQEGTAYWIVDLDSTNGLEVNGMRTQRAKLDHGDKITIGSTDIAFRRDLA